MAGYTTGTLDVRVRGNTLVPPSILSHFSIVCAILRQLHLFLYIALFTDELRSLHPSTFIVDQLSACVPLLRLVFPSVPVLFYCHFPDKLLTERRSWVKRVYRVPFDWLESWSTGCASVIVVNSEFTRGIFGEAFPGLRWRRPRVVYPCVDLDDEEGKGKGKRNPEKQQTQYGSAHAKSERVAKSERHDEERNPSRKPGRLWNDDKRLLLSINRFEGAKNIELALRAFAGLSVNDRSNARLVIAGGYDPRLSSQTSYLASLVACAESLKLMTATFSNLITALSPSLPSTDVVFLLSIPSSLKETLLENASVLIYTPPREHFGIVPLEAMRAGCPVLAATTGGPRESIVDAAGHAQDQTGWLRDPNNVGAWTEVLSLATSGMPESQLHAMGEAGRRRVRSTFSRDVMAKNFEEVLYATNAGDGSPVVSALGTVLGGGLLLGIVMAVVAVYAAR